MCSSKQLTHISTCLLDKLCLTSNFMLKQRQISFSCMAWISISGYWSFWRKLSSQSLETKPLLIITNGISVAETPSMWEININSVILYINTCTQKHHTAENNTVLKMTEEFPGGPVVRTLGAWVWSLVRKLRSCKPCSVATKKKKERKENDSEGKCSL